MARGRTLSRREREWRRPLPIAVPPERGPKYIEAELTERGIRFVVPRGMRDRYTVMYYDRGILGTGCILARQDG